MVQDKYNNIKYKIYKSQFIKKDSSQCALKLEVCWEQLKVGLVPQ